jgi:hypothetical protein
MSMRLQAPFSEVLDAVRVHVANSPSGAVTPSWSMFFKLGKGLDLGISDSRIPEQRLAQNRFAAQVKRALNKLAADGELVKVSDGRSSAVFYTTESYKSFMARREQQEVERLAWQDRVTRLRHRIRALDIHGTDYADNLQRFVMDIDMVEALVGKAERARDLPPEYQPDEEPPDSWAGHARGGVEE